MAEIEKLYELGIVKDIVGVTRQTLYNHIKNGKLKAVKIGHEYRIRESDLKQYLEQGHN